MKKLIIKIASVCAIGLLILTQTGCSDLLDQKPQGGWEEGDNPGGSFETDIFALYAKMRGYNVSSGVPPLAFNFRCEDIEKGSSSSDGAGDAAMYDDFNYVATNGLLGSYWTGNYEIVHNANRVLDKLKQKDVSGEVITDADLINKSEAHFFRAFAYFNLVRAFGDVPLIDFKIDDAAEANIPKSPASQIYELIDTDLTEAEKYLPPVWDKKYVGRLTWGAARALHAKTYLMRNDWGNVYAAATEVINSGIYNLNTSFDQIFRENGENSSESVFELQCTATASLPSSNEIGSQYAEVQGVRGAGQWDLGWGWHTPTQLLADAFESGDPRKDETLLYFYRSQAEADAPGAIANKPYGEKPIAGDVTNMYYNKKVYTDPAKRAQYTKHGFWVNIRMIRFSDVVLMAAESANELTKTDEALEYLEKVRARARGNSTTILPKVTTKDQAELRKAIKHERRVELAMEWDRFYDLVRWGDAKAVLHAAGKTNYQDKHALLPLPQTEIDKSNGVLVQNPNYAN